MGKTSEKLVFLSIAHAWLVCLAPDPLTSPRPKAATPPLSGRGKPIREKTVKR
jgi:hypothetical protein